MEKTTHQTEPEDFASYFIHLGNIRLFARDILGCTCPDETLHHVIVGKPTIFDHHRTGVDLEFLIGHRLLVDVVDTSKPFDRQEIRILLEEGRAIRDRENLNRFRLVLVGEIDEAVQKAVHRMAHSLGERIHVHFLTQTTLRSLRQLACVQRKNR